MNIHVALYRWKPNVSEHQISQAFSVIENLTSKIPGIIEISTGANTSVYNEGYTHVILVRGESSAAINQYRLHPDHILAAHMIDEIEDHGIGIDLKT